MQRRWVLVVSGIVIVAALLVGGQLLLNRSARNEAGSGGAGSSGARPTDSTSQSAAASGAAADATGVRPRQPPPQKLAPIVATRPAVDGAPLHPLSVSPPNVISGFSAGKLPDGTAYAITFRPWGYGLGGPHGRNVVVTILSATPIGAAPSEAGLRGKTLLLVMDEYGGTVYEGGTYGATLTFVEDKTLLLPTLTAVKGVAP